MSPDDAEKSPQFVEVQYNLLAASRSDRRRDQNVARRHFNCCAGKIAIRGRGQVSWQPDLHALVMVRFEVIAFGL
jgi:hypothetical protein